MEESILQDLYEDSYKEINLNKLLKPKFNFKKLDIIKEDKKNTSKNVTESIKFHKENKIDKIHEEKEKDIVTDQLDDLDIIDLSKDDYIQMALHYKTLCKSYKKQLIESHKTIRELHFTIEHMERKYLTQKKQKSSLEYGKKTCLDESLKLTIEKCSVYCEKINQYVIETSDDDSACPNDRDFNESKEELIIKTLQNVIKEKKEIKNFIKPFKSLIQQINPNSEEVKKFNSTNFTTINKILKDTIDYVNENSLNKFHCKCNSYYDFEKQINKSSEKQTKKSHNWRNNLAKTSTSSSLSSFESISSCSATSSQNSDSDYFKHRPSQEFLLNTVNLFQNLFDVDCFLNVPTKMNDVYYKYGQLLNFKKAIQNVFNPNETYSTEKLVSIVQNIYKLLNDRLSSGLKELLHSTNLERVVDKFSMYDEYFPLFYKLLEQIMNALEISRLDQIMPSIRALKILATPTLC